MTNYSLKVEGFKEVIGALEAESVPPPVSTVQLYQQKEDRDVWGSLRSCVPCPAVFILKDDPHTRISQQWQYAIRAANYNMPLKDVFLLLDDGLAFANRTGFLSLDSPGHADYFFNRSLSLSPPSLDKVRTTSRSVMTGVEQSGFLRVEVFDSRFPPPLKPGFSYPNDISEVNPDAYLYNPKDNPEMFLVANIVNTRGEVVQFPRGATYPWFLGGLSPVSFMPHIANAGYGDIFYRLDNLIKLPIGVPTPSPYRFE